LPETTRLTRRPVALVNLPVGATDDRVVGSLNLERALTTGQRRFEPGLLAAAHRGILYIDEVNLLGDHLVDLLLDAAAMGVNHVEREGLAFRHPARFVLVGTMNPEEGDLRPQLLDRFGLAVEVEPMLDPASRAEVVRRRLAFESDPEAFRAKWSEADRKEGERIVAAQVLLPSVQVPDGVLTDLCALCAREGADGLRADLTIYRAATALAAYEGRTEVTQADVTAVAELALAHRRTRPPHGTPPPAPSSSPRDQDSPPSDRPNPPDRAPFYAGSASTGGEGARAQSETDDTGQADDSGELQVLPAARPEIIAQWSPRIVPPRKLASSGRRGKPIGVERRGVTVGATQPRGPATDPALAATLRAAAPWQVERGRNSDERVIFNAADLRVKIRALPVRHLVLLSAALKITRSSEFRPRSMGARERMRQTKAAVLSLLVDAYQKRDHVGLITFGRGGARLVLPPTRSVRVAARELVDLPIGGATPLAAGLELASRVIGAARRREPGLVPLIVLLTDGRGNLPIAAGGNPESEALGLAAQLGRAGIRGLVVDTETGPIRLGLAQKLAEVWAAERRSLDALSGPGLPEAVRQALFARIA
jgi:magnesium chelatase subunit D